MDGGSKDLISGLPNPVISHILSFLSTKEAASTSVLSKRWRFLFALVPNLEFDDSVVLHSREGSGKKDVTPTSFMDFVDRVLALQGNDSVSKFSLTFINDVDSVRVTGWILNVLGRGVSDLDLKLLKMGYRLPSEIFVSKTLVRLTLGTGDYHIFIIDVEAFFLPKLKRLYLDLVEFKEDDVGFAKLLSGCPVLEELVLVDIKWEDWKSFSLSNTTLKRLTLFCNDLNKNPKSMSFDTPNLVYLEYFDTIAYKYPKLNFGSLVEASLGLGLTSYHRENVRFTQDYANSSEDDANSSEDDANSLQDDEETEMVGAGNATDFLMAICNVQILYLSSVNLEVLKFLGEKIPVFNNLIQLTVESYTRGLEMEFLSGLLKNCPNLETLIFMGDIPFYDDGRYFWIERHQWSIPSWILSSSVKVIKVYMSGPVKYVVGLEQIKQYMERTMPNLEELILYSNVSFTSSLSRFSSPMRTSTMWNI